MRYVPGNLFATFLGALLIAVALVLSHVTLASGRYAGVLSSAVACAALGLLCLAAPAVRGPAGWRLAAVVVALPVAFIADDVVRRTANAEAAVVVEPDTRSSFALDGSKPFVIELGRGSGLRGLDIVWVDGTGAAEMHRIAGGRNVEGTSVRLPPAEVKELVDLVNSSGLTGMGRNYSIPKVADGTQWVLWIEQGGAGKSIYFNNAFPNEIRTLASAMDAALGRAGLGTASWCPVPERVGRDRQAALWARIRPPR